MRQWFFSPSYDLHYNKDEIEQGEMVAEFLYRLIGNEDSANEVIKQSQKRKADNEIKEKENEVKAKEFKKRCNVCGNIFCYTWDDLNKNKALKRDSFLNAMAATAGGLAGQYAASAVSSQKSHDLDSKIIDYDKCPSCGSRDLTDITDDEMKQAKTPQSSQSVSVVGELKQYKELLDAGIITEDEFDAKKKQLLGL